jgi:hypothetical protein
MSEQFPSNGMPQQSTPESRAYKAYRKHLTNIIRGIGDEDEIREWAERNAHVSEMAQVSLKDLRPSTVHIDEVMTNMSVMYANDELIGDRIMPVIFNSGKLSAIYFAYDRRDRTAYPDDTMSDRGDPAELNQNRTTTTIGLTPRSLKEYLDWYTIQNQSAPLNEIVDVVENVLYGLKFRQELRVITASTTAANFGSNTLAVAAGDRWDSATGGDPGAVVDAAMAATWSGSGPGKWVAQTSLNVHNVLKRHPKILDRFKTTGGAPMMATRQMLAEYFEVDEYVVGKARNDTANIGQTASYSRMWPDTFGIYRVSDRPGVRNAAFGYTIQDQPTQQDLQFLLEKSSKGAYQSRASHADVQQVVCSDCAYLVTTPIG